MFDPDDAILREILATDSSFFQIVNTTLTSILHDKVDLVSIVKAAQMIQNKEIVLKSSERNVPLSSLVNLLSSGIKMSNDYSSLLRTLAKIRFVPVWKFMPNSTIGITHEFVSFNEAELSGFSDCCCTATYIHDSLVSESRTLFTNTFKTPNNNCC